MFHIELLVHDKKLAEVLRNLEGKVYNIQVKPARLVNAEKALDITTPLKETGKRQGKRAAKKAIRKGKAVGVTDTILAMPGEFGVKQVAAHGYQKNYVYSAVARLINEGKVEKISPGHWKVISTQQQQQGTTDTPILSERQVG